MKKLLRELMALVVIGVVSAGAFAQGKPRNDKRPIKEPEKVVTKDKHQKPPPPKDNKRPKPDNRKKP